MDADMKDSGKEFCLFRTRLFQVRRAGDVSSLNLYPPKGCYAFRNQRLKGPVLSIFVRRQCFQVIPSLSPPQ
ncbi:hypothetical protein ATANTOWER_006758 [Ataeniobius toweri]|uniref:Ycf15 n=1 Tax=Ataeniobius toweri TaxID=208326 RepID=A0ABU7BWG2_9TELE|nr:hypothetical protein [Ataeniobius toweri]